MTDGPTIKDRYFSTSGARLRFRDAGRGEAILFVHGFSSSMDGQWGQPGLMAKMAAQGWRTIAFDLRGHGGSEKPHDAALYQNQRMAFDAIDLLDHLEIERAHLVAYSLGAHIMMRALPALQARFKTATIGGSAGRLDWTEQDTANVIADAEELETGAMTRHIARLWPPHKPKPTAEELAAISQRRLANQDARALAAVKRVMPEQAITRDDLARIAIPMLGIVGMLDGQRKDVLRTAAAVPDFRLVEIEGAGHGDAPAHPRFCAALNEFLRRHAEYEDR